MLHQSARTQNETEETVLGVQLLDGVKQTGNHIVTTRSLTTRQDYTHIHLRCVGNITLFEFNEGHSVGVGEKLLDFLLVINTLSGFTLLHFDSSLKSFWQFWLISSTCRLQCTSFHHNNLRDFIL